MCIESCAYEQTNKCIKKMCIRPMLSVISDIMVLEATHITARVVLISQ